MKTYKDLYKHYDATLSIKPNGEKPVTGIVNLMTSAQIDTKDVTVAEINGKLYIIPLVVFHEFSDGESVLKEPDSIFLITNWRSDTLRRIDKVLDIKGNDSAFMKKLKEFINSRPIEFDGDGIAYVRAIMSEIEKGTITMKKAEDFIGRFGCEFEIHIIKKTKIM
jgi:hypothetical protein